MEEIYADFSAVATLYVSVLLVAPAFGQDVVPDRNVNMVAGTSWPVIPLMTKDRNSHAFDHRFTVTSK